MLSRRGFLHSSLMATGAALLPREAQRPPLSFDLHTHPGAFFNKGKPGYVGDDSLGGTVRGMRGGRLTGAFFSLVADAPLIELTPTGVKTRGAYTPGEAVREYERQLALLRAQLRGTPAFAATRADDLLRAQREHTVAAFLACEGGEFLDGDAAHVDRLYADGIRSLQLVHYVPSALGDLQTQPPEHHGLSALGRAVVSRCNARGMLIDVAHASMETVQQVAARTTAPIILSHSILSMDSGRLLGKLCKFG